MTLGTQTHCAKCGNPTDVFGSKWCAACWYPGIDATWARYMDLMKEGYTQYQAKVGSGSV